MEGKEAGNAHIAGQLLIVLHQLFVLLVHRQHLADPVGRRLRLNRQGEARNNVSSAVYDTPARLTEVKVSCFFCFFDVWLR